MMDHIERVSNHTEFEYDKKVIKDLENFGYLEDARNLPDSQQERLFTLLYNYEHNPYLKCLFELGLEVVKSIDHDACDCIYIRGSVSRGTARRSDDTDFVIFTKDVLKIKKQLMDFTKEHEDEIRDKCDLTRTKSLIGHLVYKTNSLEDFSNNPLLVDIKDSGTYPTYAYHLNNALEFYSFLNYNTTLNKILKNPEQDPLSFYERIISIAKEKPYEMSKKDCSHFLAILFARICGIQLKGDLPQNNIVRIRDEYLKCKTGFEL